LEFFFDIDWGLTYFTILLTVALTIFFVIKYIIKIKERIGSLKYDKLKIESCFFTPRCLYGISIIIVATIALLLTTVYLSFQYISSSPLSSTLIHSTINLLIGAATSRLSVIDDYYKKASKALEKGDEYLKKLSKANEEVEAVEIE